ncbi:hypothetical protein [Adhaeretor mobilis]|uniref:Uncharacterized protein n=1 Tax=Adhaeretor mobilis TaxID=1930276 RepID=A0A517MUX8_9BACT|nr:hypothetical protein [Adhaeretor mobilis]QDS98682.1 hypothetical protein HG15A2_19630 [Adhaeretor mobilis]
MTRSWINGIHVFICLILGAAVWAARWVWAGLQSEYGRRGPNGEYLYDLSDPGTVLQVNVTGIAAGLVLILLYLLIVWLFRRLGPNYRLQLTGSVRDR